jgi:insertion element IS1 protein InsB
MIEETITHRCEKCGSADIHPNGMSVDGRQKYYCKRCGYHGRLRYIGTSKAGEAAEAKRADLERRIFKASLERCSLRGIRRIFGVSRDFILSVLKKSLSTLRRLKDSVADAQPGDVVELDELWSFVGAKRQKRWIWVAICRRTREIIAFAIGDRSERTCRTLWNNIPATYKKLAVFYSDFWEPYQTIFPPEIHEAVGKETGQTAHIERWNNTLRQRIARFVRKSLSFSKCDQHHFIYLRLFINSYNATKSVRP